MGGKGGQKREVYDYLLSVDIGLCHGPIDAVNSVEIKDKIAYVGPVTTGGLVPINKKKLFGGNGGEGGIRGAMEFHLGTTDQCVTREQAARYNTFPANLPGYRGIAHIFFRGGTDPAQEFDYADLLSYSEVLPGNDYKHDLGFKWTSNNPYHPGVKVSVTRQPQGLTENVIWPITGVDENGDYTVAADGDAFDPEYDKRKLPDANPAAIIYETMTNADWGFGEPASALNLASYEAAAVTLKDEHFGLSLRFERQDKIRTYISEILDHINAVHYQDPRTGLWNLKLIRGDYVEEELRELNASNSTVESLKRRLWGETINEVKVEFTNPVSEELETVSAKNAANIAIQGGLRGDTRTYYGIRNPYLARKVAQRDVEEASTPLFSAVVSTNRSFWDVNPGDVLALTDPDEGIERVPVRVMKKTLGKTEDRAIKLEVIEDIFAADRVEQIVVPEPPPEPEPPPAPQNFTDPVIMTPPLPLLTRVGALRSEIDDNYPVTAAMFFARREFSGLVEIDAYGPQTAANGTSVDGVLTTFSPVRSVGLSADLVEEISSTIPASLVNQLDLDGANPGDLFFIGSSEALHEIVMLDSYDSGLDEWTIQRGIWDTVPRAWAEGDPMYALEASDGQLDDHERFAPVTVGYKLLPTTSAGEMDPADGTIFSTDLTERLHAPFRPANVEIEGNGFGNTQYLSGPYPTTIELTWSNRNRATEDSVAQTWGAANVTPESGQTTTIRVVDDIGGVQEFEATGLTGTSYDLALSNLTGFRYYRVEFWSERDGVESIMAASRELEIRRLGYGWNYGNDYGTN